MRFSAGVCPECCLSRRSFSWSPIRTAEGILLATERYDKSDPVNLGSGMEISIRDLATTIAAMTGFTGRIVWDTSQPNGQPRRCLDTTRAKALIGFEATTTLDRGLAETVAWYRAQQVATDRVAA